MKRVPIYLSNEEFSEIVNDYKCFSDDLYSRDKLKKTAATDLSNKFHSKWNSDKITFALFRESMIERNEEMCNKVDWDNTDCEILNDIKNLLELDIPVQPEIADRYGISESISLITDFAILLDSEAKEFDRYNSDENGGGLDDEDIIRAIENGYGDLYGY